MKITITISAITLLVFFFSSFFGPVRQESKRQADWSDTLKEERERYIRQILDSLQDKKDMNADSVFKNVQIFGGKEAIKVTHFLGVMNYWGRALGISCTYCHRTDDWASDEISKKQIAREMYKMRVSINRDILANIKGLKSNPVRVNCGTCHRGDIIPAPN